MTSLLMLAYHHAGRSDEALAAFASLRKRLADELGADPGAEIEQLHQRILR
jgi:DNA-binding SARP family transcriptional activator